MNPMLRLVVVMAIMLLVTSVLLVSGLMGLAALAALLSAGTAFVWAGLPQDPDRTRGWGADASK